MQTVLSCLLIVFVLIPAILFWPRRAWIRGERGFAVFLALVTAIEAYGIITENLTLMAIGFLVGILISYKVFHRSNER